MVGWLLAKEQVGVRFSLAAQNLPYLTKKYGRLSSLIKIRLFQKVAHFFYHLGGSKIRFDNVIVNAESTRPSNTLLLTYVA